MDMQGADLPRRQGSAGGLELGLLAVLKESHGGLLVIILYNSEQQVGIADV